jgi:hypothetical protein
MDFLFFLLFLGGLCFCVYVLQTIHNHVSDQINSIRAKTSLWIAYLKILLIADFGLLIWHDHSSHEFSYFFILTRIELKLVAELCTRFWQFRVIQWVFLFRIYSLRSSRAKFGSFKIMIHLGRYDLNFGICDTSTLYGWPKFLSTWMLLESKCIEIFNRHPIPICIRVANSDSMVNRNS